MDHLTKMDKNNKFNVAAADILNFIYSSQLIYYSTYLQKHWQVYYVWGPTYTHAKILNKKKI